MTRNRRDSKSTRRSADDNMSVGQDSFLDTTANLVGILIILVVVIGTKTKIDAIEYGKQQAELEPSVELEQTQRQARGLKESLQKQKLQLVEYQMEQRYRKTERDRLLIQVATAREVVESKLQNVDEEQRKQIEQQSELKKLQSQIQDVERQMGTADERERPTILLEHLPTPMARTVFTKEMHVQLKGREVTVIPWDRLVEMLKNQVPLALRRQASRGSVEDKLGPVGGFLMHYRMDAIQGGYELDRFELESTPSAPSESLQESLSSAGRLRLELASRDPRETVVTVWVYPDSFAEFRELKAQLFDEGFLCAARPLPENVRIGASPRGSRSSAQ